MHEFLGLDMTSFFLSPYFPCRQTTCEVWGSQPWQHVFMPRCSLFFSSQFITSSVYLFLLCSHVCDMKKEVISLSYRYVPLAVWECGHWDDKTSLLLICNKAAGFSQIYCYGNSRKERMLRLMRVQYLKSKYWVPGVKSSFLYTQHQSLWSNCSHCWFLLFSFFY